MFDHLRETDQTYMAHMRQALHYTARLQLCAIKVFAHAWLPNMFTKDASNEISRLYKEMHSE